ncbi:MAG: FMN-binding glutamate synthase family protein [Acidobacteria bacterium]|nr:MAG: FMN-binding glutamate synthase family protein [Acidobacteriota bacterium]
MPKKPWPPRTPVPPRVPGFIEHWSPKVFLAVSAVALAATCVAGYFEHGALWCLVVIVPLVVLGLVDMFQTSHAIRRNFPVIGHLRYVLESLRPEIRQYFVESDLEENPISREKRSIVYQRAKGELDTLPFGTRADVYRVGYEWIAHSMAPVDASGEAESYRVAIGEGRCAKPYRAALLNVSAMSFGSLSANAILALNEGARLGGFYHNTGEGGISPYHLKPGGDLVWQIGTGYFGCRKPDGTFCPESFQKGAAHEQVRMIEVKLSQGAKPGHGGILPGRKVTEEIARIRHVPAGKDVISPPAHTAFRTPRELLAFLDELRELSGGKPVGFKLCVGRRRDFLAIVKAMVETGSHPDFITVDGGEGGTGAAPLEFSNSVGMPLADGLNFVHNALVGAGLREKVKIIAAGKITTGFHVLHKIALGADLTNAARAMMIALGCIQALKCNTNQCPVGVATQDPRLMRGLVVADKARRVANFQRKTVEAAFELLGAAGLRRPDELGPQHIFRRTASGQIRSLAEIHPPLSPGALLDGSAPEEWLRLWDAADPASFG